MPHIHTGEGQFDFTVSGYVVYQNTTLLIKHKYLPIWTPPAGHIELNQTPIDALYAEIREESGIGESHLTLVETMAYPPDRKRGDGATELPLPFDMEYHDIQDGHRHINMAYILASDTNNVEPGPGESNTFKWFTLEDLETFSETTASIISCAQHAIHYMQEHGV